MGGNQSEISNIGTQKGEGYRILSVRPNSPLDTHADVFFDFIIDVISEKQPEKSPREILEKLTDGDAKKPARVAKKLEQIIAENENHPITIRVVSTKYRNVKNLQVTPNRIWNGSNDLLGIQTRLQRYDEAFESYCPISDIRLNSPIKKAGIVEGDFLIGCKQFKYNSINELLENIYDRFYDKTVENKTVNFAVYNLANDQLKLAPVLLARGWGDKGLLGCQFLQGHLNRFPKNLATIREQLKLKKKQSDQTQRIKKELSECNGASVQLIQSLKAQRSKKTKNFRQLKNILLLPPTQLNKQAEINMKREGEDTMQRMMKSNEEQGNQYVDAIRFKQLESRVITLQQMFSSIKNYIENVGESDEDL